jgi:copper(I)-binding protein
MFTGLKRPLKQGEKVKATLDFAHAGKLTVDFAVGSIGAMGPGGKAGGSSMGGMKM